MHIEILHGIGFGVYGDLYPGNDSIRGPRVAQDFLHSSAGFAIALVQGFSLRAALVVQTFLALASVMANVSTIVEFKKLCYSGYREYRFS